MFLENGTKIPRLFGNYCAFTFNLGNDDAMNKDDQFLNFDDQFLNFEESLELFNKAIKCQKEISQRSKEEVIKNPQTGDRWQFPDGHTEQLTTLTKRSNSNNETEWMCRRTKEDALKNPILGDRWEINGELFQIGDIANYSEIIHIYASSSKTTNKLLGKQGENFNSKMCWHEYVGNFALNK